MTLSLIQYGRPEKQFVVVNDYGIRRIVHYSDKLDSFAKRMQVPGWILVAIAYREDLEIPELRHNPYDGFYLCETGHFGWIYTNMGDSPENVVERFKTGDNFRCSRKLLMDHTYWNYHARGQYKILAPELLQDAKDRRPEYFARKAINLSETTEAAYE